MSKPVSFDILAQKIYAIIAAFGTNEDDFQWIVSVDAAIFVILACLLSHPVMCS
jgi:hypothetical protein